MVELLDPCPIRHVRQTHESVRRLSYRCGDRRFRGVLSSGVRLCVGVRDGRESWRGGLVRKRPLSHPPRTSYANRTSPESVQKPGANPTVHNDDG